MVRHLQKLLQKKQENPKKKKTRKSQKKQMWRGIPHLIHGIPWREWVVVSYNQEWKMVGHLQKLWKKKS